MKYTLSPKAVLFIAVSVILVFSAGRLVKGHRHASYFIVAGTDFVDSTKTPSHIIIQPGQGYDGQFFYRYALNPFDLSKNSYGINVDHPAYRMQRIAYPVLASIVSFGSVPRLVPWALLLLNIAAFIGCIIYTIKLIELIKGNISQALLPLFLCGIYMSLARDLAEVTELFFFTGTVYYLVRKQYWLFSIFALFTIMSRETSVIALLPMSVALFIRRKENAIPVIYLVSPFIIWAAWKVFLFTNMPSVTDSMAGYFSLGVPFKGMVQGFKENFDFSSNKNIFQFIFWIGYLIWNIFLAAIVFSKVSFRTMRGNDNSAILKPAYLLWLLFAICFSDVIYGDDWGFVRIFSLWNMTGLLLLIINKQKTGRLFNAYSTVIVALTIIRLIIKV